MSRAERFKPKGGGETKRPSDVGDRGVHARTLLRALDALPKPSAEGIPGVYLNVEGRLGEPMITKSLDASDLTLLRVDPERQNQPPRATVFATENGLEKLRRKIEDFAAKDRINKKDGSSTPYNANLVQSIGAIVEAGLRALWRSPPTKFPAGATAVAWEVWLDREQADLFIESAGEFGVAVGGDRLIFPEDIVVIATATPNDLALAARRLAGIRALAAPSVTADHFDTMDIEEQDQWVENLLERIRFNGGQEPNFITILDRGISRSHPLIQPALSRDDRHAANPAWSVEDLHGHGTQLAGLALYGDLTGVLQMLEPIEIRHRLESAKIIPDAGHNPHHLLGAITRHGIDAVEAMGVRRRTFALASTTEDDTPHDGAPTSWSSEVDQLTSGVSGQVTTPRLLIVSAGNTDQNRFTDGDYLTVCDEPENEIESPAHAWNAIAIGAYTQKIVLPAGSQGVPLAPLGDLSPSSRTASWAKHWPIKPDVVFEGGNWMFEDFPPPLRHTALSLLTTDHEYPQRAFTTCGDTSGATALAARAITELWSDYPNLWPETIRAIFVSSARWTPQMRAHLPAKPAKGDYASLFKRYGYGVPDMERARRSASNALSLIVQDTITPFRKATTNGSDHVHNEMKLFELPWPVEALRRLEDTQVTLRVALSTFIQPNPSEPARGSKFRYASHNLRFKLKRAGESPGVFMARISKAAEEVDEPAFEEDDGWTFGRNRRDVGSVHVDELTCKASDLARRNILAVHPVSGWWKLKTASKPEDRQARFALVVEIDAGEVDVDLYAEVQAAIENLTAVQI